MRLTDLQVNQPRTVPETSYVLPHQHLCWSTSPSQQPGASSQSTPSFEGQWWLFSPKTSKLDTNDNYFLPDTVGFSKSLFRAVLHLWSVSHQLENAAAQNTQAYERMKISHFDWFRKLFPTTHSLRVSVFSLTNWGWLEADQAKGCTWETISPSGIRCPE